MAQTVDVQPGSPTCQVAPLEVLASHRWSHALATEFVDARSPESRADREGPQVADRIAARSVPAPSVPECDARETSEWSTRSHRLTL